MASIKPLIMRANRLLGANLVEQEPQPFYKLRVVSYVEPRSSPPLCSWSDLTSTRTAGGQSGSSECGIGPLTLDRVLPRPW